MESQLGSELSEHGHDSEQLSSEPEIDLWDCMRVSKEKRGDNVLPPGCFDFGFGAWGFAGGGDGTFFKAGKGALVKEPLVASR